MTANINGNRMGPYQNPDKLPLEKLELIVSRNGGYAMIPALSKEWIEDRQFLYYEIPKIYNDDGTEIIGAKDRWLEMIAYTINDLDWLLQLPFYQFWSNVIYNASIGDSLVTILQELPTFYNFETFPNDASMREHLEKLRRNVLVVYARLVTSKESKDEYISHEAHGNFLYNEFLLTLPMMLDICQLYGRENRKVVEKIISTAIKLQPAYNDDLKETVIFFTNLFKNVGLTFQDRPIPLAAGAVPLTDRGSRHTLNLDNLEDKIIHLLDASSSIRVFLDVYPSASEFFCDDYFVNEITHVYGNAIPEMYKWLNNLANNDETFIKYTELKHRLDVTRSELREIFRTVTYYHIARILEEPNPSKVPNASQCVDQFINFLDKAVREREFIIDYEVAYPVENDLDLVSQISHDVDPVKCNFIKGCIYTEFIEPRRHNSHPPVSNDSNTTVAGSSGAFQVPIIQSESQVTNGTTTKSEMELDALIKEVKDILCDFGEGFIEKCLKHYNYDATAVINAVLEESLPEELRTLDRQLPYIPPDPMEASAAVDQALGIERLNVFDNDEFDIMTRDTFDQSRVHKGKRKDKYKNLNQLLDDKSYRKEVGNIYEKYSVIQDEYDDEYDDTYESEDVGPRGVDEPLEMDGRAFTTPRILRWNDKRENGGEEDDEEEIENEASGSRGQNSRENFLQDPAELRARAEQRRLSKRGGGGGSGWKNERGPQADLVGKPKGQGNEKSVLVNRDKKNTNKASRANHNRRSGAEHKRRQGMVPS